jgi:hypothetical protein
MYSLRIPSWMQYLALDLFPHILWKLVSEPYQIQYPIVMGKRYLGIRSKCIKTWKNENSKLLLKFVHSDKKKETTGNGVVLRCFTLKVQSCSQKL